MKNHSPIFITFAMLVALVLSACGGGGGGGGGGGSTPVDEVPLEGTWHGNFEDMIGGLHTLELRISDDQITYVQVDGSLIYLTATISPNPLYLQIYDVEFSNGTYGGFFVDSGLQHMAFIDSEENIGVLQKGEYSTPNFTWEMLIGNWSGSSLTLYSDYDIAEYDSNTHVTVDSNYILAGINVWGAFNSILLDHHATYGVYITSYPGINGSGKYMLSFDGQFAVSYATDDIFSIDWPELIVFSVLSKQ